jgi:uncharacterized protein (DUF302 family)
MTPGPDDLTGAGTRGITTKLSPRSVSNTAERLAEILAQNGMKIFAIIDQQAEAHQAGLDLRETVLVIFGSPAAGTPVMAAAPLAALDLPLKVLIWADDHKTKVSYFDPDGLAARYHLVPSLAALIAGIDGVTDQLVSPEPERAHG